MKIKTITTILTLALLLSGCAVTDQFAGARALTSADIQYCRGQVPEAFASVDACLRHVQGRR